MIQKVLECDVLIIGSPTYYYDVCGHLKNFIDRTYSLYHDRKLAGRKGVAVAVQAQKGASRTIQTIEGFLSTHEFSSLGSVKGKGYHEGDVLNDEEAVHNAQKIGDKIVRLSTRTTVEKRMRFLDQLIQRGAAPEGSAHIFCNPLHLSRIEVICICCTRSFRDTLLEHRASKIVRTGNQT